MLTIYQPIHVGSLENQTSQSFLFNFISGPKGLRRTRMLLGVELFTSCQFYRCSESLNIPVLSAHLAFLRLQAVRVEVPDHRVALLALGVGRVAARQRAAVRHLATKLKGKLYLTPVIVKNVLSPYDQWQQF